MLWTADPDRDVVDRVRNNHLPPELQLMSRGDGGPGPSSVLLTLDDAGDVAGVDPHKRSRCC